MHTHKTSLPQVMSDEGYLPVAGLSSDTKTVTSYPSLYMTFLLRITCPFFLIIKGFITLKSLKGNEAHNVAALHT